MNFGGQQTAWDRNSPFKKIVVDDSKLHLCPDLRAFWFLEKTVLRKNCVSGTVLMFQLTRNSPTNAYIKLKSHVSGNSCYAGTRCTTVC